MRKRTPPLDRVLLAGGASPFMPSGLFWIVLRRSWASFAPASPPFRCGLLPRSGLRCCPSALRAARHRERERIKSDVGLAEEGKRIGRPTISRRLRERVAERIAAGETPSRVAKDIVLRRPSYFFMQRVNSLDQCCSLRRSKIFSGTSDRHRAPRLPGPTADLWVSHRRRTSMAEV